MMMQIVRCESAVAQGLRSDTSQATKMAASACERLPYPSLPLACWLWTSPLITSLAPKCPQISDRIGFRKIIHFDMCLSLSLVNGCWLAFHFQMPPVWNQNGSHRLLSSTFLRCPLYSEISQGGSVWASLVLQVYCQWMLVCSCLTWPFNRRSSEKNDFCQAQSHASGIIWCIEVMVSNRHAPRAGVCCACITGAITHTNCPASSVVKWDESLKYACF